MPHIPLLTAYPSDQIEGLESRGASPGDGARSAASKTAPGTKSRAEAAKGGKDAKGGGATAGGSGGERKKKKGEVLAGNVAENKETHGQEIRKEERVTQK